MSLEIKNIDASYGDSHILFDVSITVPDRKVIALLGRNGVGKTTTMRAVMGLTPPSKGEILFNGEPIQKLPPYTIPHKGIGYVPQGRRLFRSLTVREHLEVYHRNGDGWTPERALKFFGRLAERVNSKAGDLSGGEQQMLAIARALVTNPSLICMDEPTEGLAPLIVEEVGHLIRMIKDEGYSIFLTEQKIPFALKLADEVYVMSRGSIVYHGTPEEFAANTELKKTYLGV